MFLTIHMIYLILSSHAIYSYPDTFNEQRMLRSYNNPYHPEDDVELAVMESRQLRESIRLNSKDDSEIKKRRGSIISNVKVSKGTDYDDTNETGAVAFERNFTYV